MYVFAPLESTFSSLVLMKGWDVQTYGRVMIDPVAFRAHQPNADYNLPVRKLLERVVLTEEQYLICTPVVLGFSFATKTWGTCSYPFDTIVSVYTCPALCFR